MSIPFQPPLEDKKPMIITRDKVITFLYGKEPYQLPIWVYVNTDKLFLGLCSLPPSPHARWEDRPIEKSIHAGDEVYYILNGTLTMLNPENGGVYRVHKGESLYIPAGTWHYGHNFDADQVLLVACIAPGEDGFAPPKGVSRLKKPRQCRDELLGRWPIGEKTVTQRLRVIKPDSFLREIRGKEHRMLVSYFVSSKFIHTGMFTLQPGRLSDTEVHKGDEALYVLTGTLNVLLQKTDEWFEIKETEGFYIPEGVEHKYYNYCKDKPVTAMFAIAPKL